MSHARIGRVRMKSGGADVRVLHNPMPNTGQENWRGKLLEHAKATASLDKAGASLVGFAVIGVFSDGSSSVGLRWDNKACPIPRALMPAWVAEIIRRDLVTGPEAEEQACHVVNRANGFDD